MKACSTCRYSAFCLSTSEGFRVLFDVCAMQFAGELLKTASVANAEKVVRIVRKKLPSDCPHTQSGKEITVIMDSTPFGYYSIRAKVS